MILRSSLNWETPGKQGRRYTGSGFSALFSATVANFAFALEPVPKTAFALRAVDLHGEITRID